METESVRQCPVCKQGQVITDELPNGSHCSYCKKLIEIDFVYSAGIPVLLALLVGLSFKYDFDWLGYICTALLILFTAGYKQVVARHIAIKHYGDSD